jgi:hypothetical protein
VGLLTSNCNFDKHYMSNNVNFTEGVVLETLGEAVFGDRTISFEASICLSVVVGRPNGAIVLTHSHDCVA